MNEVKKRPFRLRRGLLFPVIGLLLIAALILVFLGLRAGKWAAKRDELKLLTLVNASHPAPDDLQQEYALMEEGMVDVRCAGDLQLMIDACQAEGFAPEIRDALVTRSLQSERFEQRVSELLAEGLGEEEAERRARETVPPPGYSEHELGLAVDLADAAYGDDEQAASPMHAYLAENAWRYGFIQRYPDGKREATGVGYVPWHYRYVGREAAQQICELGLTLDEYIDLFYPEQTD